MYKLGAIQNTKDLRDIHLAQIQSPVSIPASYQTDISFIPVLNQKNLGACVGHAHAVIHIYNEYKENGVIKNLSPRYIYALAKKLDNLAGEGTYPRVAAKVQLKGCATENTVVNNTDLSHADYINITETPDIIADAKPFRIKGYVDVANNKDALKQAIYQNGLVAVSISVGNFDSPIKKGDIGLHRVVCYGYDGDKFLFRNSWGKDWGDNGNGYFNWDEQSLLDIMVFVDVPDELVLKAKTMWKYFKPTEFTNSQKTHTVSELKPELVDLLDKARDIAGIPFIITSGFRTPAENLNAGGVQDSSHELGLAVDLLVKDGISGEKINSALHQVGFKRFGYYGDGHIHVDLDTSKPTPCYWVK